MSSILELDVSRADAPGNYRVEVIHSPAGEASATFQLRPAEIMERLGELQETLLASSVPGRRLLSRGETSVRNVGRGLFDALFGQQDVAGVYRASRAVAEERGESLRIVLRIGAPELAVLPWESMFDESADSYVSRREPLVRYVAVPVSPPPLKVRLPLQVLAVIASPRGLAMLDVGKEREDLTRALRPLIDTGAVRVQWLEHATWPALQEALLSHSWNVVHFIGHGDFDVEQDEGVLALETEQGRIHRVSARNFVDLLREAQPMPRLVVLNACESATSGPTDLFSGTAATLVRGGVSAVTAMQFEISDRAAIAFCRGFYTAIGRGHGVDDAVRSGRVAIVGLGEGSLEWITPTLYLRGHENHLFELSESESQPAFETLTQRGSPASAPEDVNGHHGTRYRAVDDGLRSSRGTLPTQRRRRGLVALVVALAAMGAGAWLLWGPAGGGGGESGGGSGNEPGSGIAACSPPAGDGWNDMELSADPTGEEEVEGGSLHFAVTSASWRARGAAWEVILETTMEAALPTGAYQGEWRYDSLIVARRTFTPTCFAASPEFVDAETIGDALIGFDVTCEPVGYIQLSIENDADRIDVTPPDLEPGEC